MMTMPPMAAPCAGLVAISLLVRKRLSLQWQLCEASRSRLADRETAHTPKVGPEKDLRRFWCSGLFVLNFEILRANARRGCRSPER
jgi:hypothetical protein